MHSFLYKLVKPEAWLSCTAAAERLCSRCHPNKPKILENFAVMAFLEAQSVFVFRHGANTHSLFALQSCVGCEGSVADVRKTV